MELFFLINIAAFLRLFFFFRDKHLTLVKLTIFIILQLLPLLLFEFSIHLFLFGLLIIILQLSSFFIEQKNSLDSRINLIRLLTIIVYIIIVIVFTSPQLNLHFSNSAVELFNNLSNSLLPHSGIHWLKASIVTAGGVILLNEVNFFIRYLFDFFGVVPKKISGSEVKIDEKEYNAGRVIGMLERVLIYFFVLINQFAAIGFIIAAKGFTRFKEMDEREFAEYVLIGTLLSSISAIFTAMLVHELING